MIEQHKHNNNHNEESTNNGSSKQEEVALEIFNDNSIDLKINTSNTLLPTTTSASPSLHDQEDFVEEFSSCGIKLTSMPRSVAFAICAGMVTIFYTISGVAQEALFVNYKDFDYGFFLTLVEFAVFTVLSFIQLRIEVAQHKHSGSNSTLVNDFSNMIHTMKAPVNSYLLLALLSVLGIGLGNESLNYLNFPTKILFKSSKLLVVMVMGVVINRTRYQLLDYLASIFIFFGLIVLYNANQSVSISFEVIGIVLMSSALLADAIAGNLQEKILKSYNASPTELIFYTYLIGTILLTIMCIVFGQFFSAIQFCMDNPYSMVIMIVFAVTAFIGVQFVHSMTKIFGILITLTTTSCRKVLSILLSFVIFPKPFVTNHLLAVVLVFFGVFLRIYKNKINEILFSSKKEDAPSSQQAAPSSNTSNPHQ